MPHESVNGFRPRILVVNEDEITRTVLLDRLAVEGYVPVGVGSAHTAMRRLEQEPFDVVLLDIDAGDGLALLSAAAGPGTDADFIMVARNAMQGVGVEALRRGACDYLPSPLRTDELLPALRRVRRDREQRREIASLRGQLGDGARGRILGRTPAMKRLFDLIERAAATDRGVLIAGEAGTGKELVARALHDLSIRSQRPFVAVRCSAVPEALAETELFGQANPRHGGTMTGRRGLIEEVRGGTLFLDHVDTVPEAIQGRLLRVLEERRIQRCGSATAIPVDFRLIATTGPDLAQMTAGSLPQSLRRHLNAFVIVVPPLRERAEDIPLLADHFRQLFARDNGTEPATITDATLAKMMEYPWPGNVGELRAWIERASLARSDAVEMGLQPAGADANGILSGAAASEWSLRRLEEEYIAAVLEWTGGHRGRAAAVLGIDRRTLYRKLKRLKHTGRAAST